MLPVKSSVRRRVKIGSVELFSVDFEAYSKLK